MNQKEIRDLIEFLIEKDIAEFELERGDVKIKVKRPTAVIHTQVAAEPQLQAAPQPATKPTVNSVPQTSSSAPAGTGSAATQAESEAELQIVHSPIVGTFYESPSPGSPPFIKVGDTVSVGQVLCIVEAMKLMNEIESDFAGVIVKRHIENGQPVEYGQALFAIRPA